MNVVNGGSDSALFSYCIVCVCATDRFSTTFVIELHPLFILKAFEVLSLRIFNVILVFAAAAPRIENNKNENEL